MTVNLEIEETSNASSSGNSSISKTKKMRPKKTKLKKVRSTKKEVQIPIIDGSSPNRYKKSVAVTAEHNDLSKEDFDMFFTAYQNHFNAEKQVDSRHKASDISTQN